SNISIRSQSAAKRGRLRFLLPFYATLSAPTGDSRFGSASGTASSCGYSVPARNSPADHRGSRPHLEGGRLMACRGLLTPSSETTAADATGSRNPSLTGRHAPRPHDARPHVFTASRNSGYEIWRAVMRRRTSRDGLLDGFAGARLLARGLCGPRARPGRADGSGFGRT